MPHKWIEFLCSELMQFLMSLYVLYVSMAMSRRCCLFMFLRLYVSCCISNLQCIFTYTKYWTPNISAQTKFVYHLLNLPYSPMIIICSPSTVIICVKRSQIWSYGYCLCYMFHFFLFGSSFQSNFNFFNYQPWQQILSVTMCCVVMTSVFFMVFSNVMKCWLVFVCMCRMFGVCACVCISFTDVNFANLDLMLWWD